MRYMYVFQDLMPNITFSFDKIPKIKLIAYVFGHYHINQ